MTDKVAFEKSFKRPRNYFRRSQQEQWQIDKRLGILDWDGDDLSEDEVQRFQRHYF
jgi:hypothetical protein